MAKVSLGRGLGALISDRKNQSKEKSEGTELEIKQIVVNRFQPRHHFDEESIQELANSIQAKGIIQPLLVRKIGEEQYELIAGERRLRASLLLGLKKVPVVIREGSDEESLELALIENIQRNDLNPIEEAIAYQRLAKEFHLTQEGISEKVGKKRTTVANTLRLLSLCSEIQNYIQNNQISMGHARALLALPSEKEQLDFALRIIAEGISVREIEQRVTDKLHPSSAQKKKLRRMKRDSHVADLEEKIQKIFGTQVAIRHRGKSGRIEIYYYSMDDFDRILDKLGMEKSL